ncbi:MAG TPA: ATP-binding cassette domain-containing protein [Spirochaetia bacterium]|nr:ATP-binding cassette domain-containing protein [Spirochaetales bacterium]HPD80694.1 ATP-binding cassette domain-containing protein [Spirochaetales bacterium]HQK34515.1 ATP-binding cassette domain-containing protein [Spirochaetales bacterium]HRS65456.1 ATP-binding cassette domain-containing protein [Spirochaetia bacterium]HRV27975.1 ATP-binding cassette domain-containing protein [Spirochaetia bacterium]
MKELKLRSICKEFHSTKTKALIDVSCSFYAGSIHALVGENGAGKSTLARILAGVEKPDSGNILIDNKEFIFHNKRQAEKAGIGFVPQYPAVAKNLFVFEQLYLGHEPTRFIFTNRKECIRKSHELISTYGFSVDPLKKIADCSASEIREIEILQALSNNINMLILDEPTTVLEKHECAKLFQIIKNLRDSGKIIVYISHRVSEILELADTITILRNGKMLRNVEAHNIAKIELSKIVAGNIKEEKLQFASCNANANSVINVSHVITKEGGAGSLYDITFEVKENECIAIVGADGNGLESLENILTGFEKPKSGLVTYYGKSISSYTIKELYGNILGYVVSDRETRGLCFHESVLYNCLGKKLNTLDYKQCSKKCRQYAAKLMNDFLISGTLQAPIETLSGGNRQRLLLGRVLTENCRILLFANPFQGLDNSSRNLFCKKLVESYIHRKTIILLTNDIDDLYEIPWSKLFVLYRGMLYPYTGSSNSLSMEMLMTGVLHA